MNRECRNCAHANGGIYPLITMGRHSVACSHGLEDHSRIVFADGLCSHFRPYTEKVEGNPLDTLTVPREFAAAWFAKMAKAWQEKQVRIDPSMPEDSEVGITTWKLALANTKRIKAMEEKLRGFGRHPTVACSMSVENQKRITALEEDEGHARTSRLLHGAEIMRALDRLLDIERRLDRLEEK